MKQSSKLPDYFVSLVAIFKLVAVDKISSDFHKRHYHAIETACAFLRVLAGSRPPLQKAFSASLPQPISIVSVAIRQLVPTLGLTEDKVQWLDAQTTEILKVLAPVVRDPELPPWLSECKWVIEGAFYAP